MDKKEKLQLTFNILLFVTIGLLLLVLIVLIQNKDMIGKDPLSYGMNLHNFTSCSCIDGEGKDWVSKNGGFLHTDGNSEPVFPVYNWSELPITKT